MTNSQEPFTAACGAEENIFEQLQTLLKQHDSPNVSNVGQAQDYRLVHDFVKLVAKEGNNISLPKENFTAELFSEIMDSDLSGWCTEGEKFAALSALVNARQVTTRNIGGIDDIKSLIKTGTDTQIFMNAFEACIADGSREALQAACDISRNPELWSGNQEAIVKKAQAISSENIDVAIILVENLCHNPALDVDVYQGDIIPFLEEKSPEKLTALKSKIPHLQAEDFNEAKEGRGPTGEEFAFLQIVIGSFANLHEGRVTMPAALPAGMQIKSSPEEGSNNQLNLDAV